MFIECAPSSKELAEVQNGLCFYCAKPLGNDFVTREHVRPKCWFSRTDEQIQTETGAGKRKAHHIKMDLRKRASHRNIVLACGACNWRKSDTAPTAEDIAKLEAVYGEIDRRRKKGSVRHLHRLRTNYGIDFQTGKIGPRGVGHRPVRNVDEDHEEGQGAGGLVAATETNRT